MASIMRGAVLNILESARPRILGLTASFVSGSTSSATVILKKRKELETLFQANICSPDIPLAPDDVIQNKFTYVTYPPSDILQYKKVIEETVRNILRVIPSRLFEVLEKWVNKGWKLFESLGAEALRFWLREGIVVQLLGKAEELEKNSDILCQKIAKRIRDGLGPATIALQNADFLPGTPLPAQSEQLKELLRLLEKLNEDANKSRISASGILGGSNGESKVGDNGGKGSNNDIATFKGIIFVEQNAVTEPLSYMINKHFQAIEESKLKKCPNCLKDYKPVPSVSLPVNGVGSMVDSVRNANMDSFRSGKTPILVSTAALEEGIDVPDCSFVVRYDTFTTTKSHVQGSGRARCKSAKIYYFKNDPNVECSKADLLSSIAKDKNLNLSMASLKIELASSLVRTVLTTVEYPYYPKGNGGGGVGNGGAKSDGANGFNCENGGGKEGDYSDNREGGGGGGGGVTVGKVVGNGTLKAPNSGEVNFFNCLQIFYEYIQRVMRQSYDPMKSFEVEEEIIRLILLKMRKNILSVIYPSPSGVKQVTQDDIDQYWGQTEVRDVVRPVELLKKLSTFDILKRRAVYVIVIRLHTEGLLNYCNEPTVDAINKCQSACPAFAVEDKFKLTNKFPKKEEK